jgi:hypothetical protein
MSPAAMTRPDAGPGSEPDGSSAPAHRPVIEGEVPGTAAGREWACGKAPAVAGGGRSPHRRKLFRADSAPNLRVPESALADARSGPRRLELSVAAAAMAGPLAHRALVSGLITGARAAQTGTGGNGRAQDQRENHADHPTHRFSPEPSSAHQARSRSGRPTHRCAPVSNDAAGGPLIRVFTGM